MAIVAQEKVDTYLGRLRACLRSLDNEEVNDIVEELRSHILDKATVNGVLAVREVDAAIKDLGSPEDLASEYLTDAALARAEASRSPFRILASLFRWASLSVFGFFVLIGSLVGYFLGVALILCAVLKPIHPQSAGLWSFPDSGGDLELSLRLGFGSAPAGGQDVLGWWMVPIGLVAGFGLVMLTTRFAIWCVRLYRKSRAPQRI
jgi:HAAS domain-containing protein